MWFIRKFLQFFGLQKPAHYYLVTHDVAMYLVFKIETIFAKLLQRHKCIYTPPKMFWLGWNFTTQVTKMLVQNLFQTRVHSFLFSTLHNSVSNFRDLPCLNHHLLLNQKCRVIFLNKYEFCQTPHIYILLKFNFSEKATKIWSYLPLDLTFT